MFDKLLAHHYLAVLDDIGKRQYHRLEIIYLYLHFLHKMKIRHSLTFKDAFGNKSCGVSRELLLAKIASRIRKRRGQFRRSLFSRIIAQDSPQNKMVELAIVL